MNYNIKDYLSLFKMDENLSKKINNFIIEFKQGENQQWAKHSYGNGNPLEDWQNEKEFDIADIHWILPENLYREIMEKIWKCLSEYCNMLGEQLNYMGHIGWNGFTSPRVNWYDKETKMDEHFDHIHSIFDGERKGIPTFTVLGLLKNADKGGELILWGEEEIKTMPGDILVFPSNIFFRHKVNEIIEGTRVSFVSWVW